VSLRISDALKFLDNSAATRMTLLVTQGVLCGTPVGATFLLFARPGKSWRVIDIFLRIFGTSRQAVSKKL
jgi:hypothetical protein